MNDMKVLLWDIETAPMLVTAWGLWKPHLGHQNIQRHTSLLCAAWKWLGQQRVQAASVEHTAPEEDASLVQALHAVLSEADVLVGHNGDKFDLRKFNSRAIFHGLPPLPPIRTVDTLKIARKHFFFDSNRLDALGQYLGVGQKIETDYKLWLTAMAGSKKSLDKMVAYNKEDVRLLERVYLALRPYMVTHPNAALHSKRECCPKCGSADFTKQGFKHTRTVTRQQYQCQACRGWFSGELVKSVKVS